MSNIYLSKSRYCKCVQCPKILWLIKYKPEVAVPSEKDAVFENGSIIIYNKSFEPARNSEIARMYPDLKDEMERFNNNIVDFLVPFKQRKYYIKEMHGSASIKAVLPALYPNDPELNYHNLPVVHNEGEASEAFLSLKNKSKDEQEKIRHGLLVYCELDTYAMVKLWEKFNEICKLDS